MGGGGKGGGGGHTPIEKPNTLESAQRLKIIDLLCEGVAGQDVTFKNIYLDNTPIQNSDGTYNFTAYVCLPCQARTIKTIWQDLIALTKS